MMTDTPNEKIRHAIAWQLNRLGVHDANTLHETILIRHGLFCGRKFDCEGYQVVWFLEEDEIKFFSPVGDLLKASSAGECLHNYESSTSDRRAA
jgi:hypothetical protein